MLKQKVSTNISTNITQDFSETGLSETDFSDTGFSSETGFSDTGFSVTSFFVYFIFCFSFFYLLLIYMFLVFFCAVHWISHHVPKRTKKNWREFPLGGPSPCGKAGLAPCRRCTFSCVFWLPSLNLNSKTQNPNSKSKLQTSPKSSQKKMKRSLENLFLIHKKYQNPKSKISRFCQCSVASQEH